MRRKHQTNEQIMLRLLTRRAYYRQGGRCYHCQEAMPLSAATGDHLKPRYQGGLTISGNIVAACVECNNQRNAETNRQGGKMDMTVGDTTPRSPFEALAPLRRALRPMCPVCGWAKGGPDSWDGQRCKCGHEEEPIQRVS